MKRSISVADMAMGLITSQEVGWRASEIGHHPTDFQSFDGDYRMLAPDGWKRKSGGDAPAMASALAAVEIRDLAGDGDHYAANVISAAFKGKSRVQQHQMVYAALKGRMGGELHALALQTSIPEE